MAASPDEDWEADEVDEVDEVDDRKRLLSGPGIFSSDDWKGEPFRLSLIPSKRIFRLGRRCLL